ncbi:MAG: DUF1131 family protein [Sneathiellaceae bacterium]
MKALVLRPVIICLAVAGFLALGPGRAGLAADGQAAIAPVVTDGPVKAETGGGGTAERPPADTRPADTILQVGDAGVAGIGAATPFEPMAVRRQLPPGFVVTAGTYQTGDEALPTLNVLHQDAPILIVYSDGGQNVSLIQVLSPRIRVAQGRIGDPFSTFFPEAGESACVRGVAQLAGTAICTQPDAPRVNLLFDGSTWEGPETAMPPSAVLRDWPLKYVIWSAAPLSISR